MRLGCAEFCVPGKMLEEKLEVLEKYKMWLELANEKKRSLKALSSFNVEVETVQAYKLHELHLLGKDAAIRKAALAHVKETIDIARETDAKNVLIAIYGFNSVSVRKSIEILRALSQSSMDIKILVEALDAKRTSFCPSLKEISTLIKKTGRENIALAADTFHAYESGENVCDFKNEVVELHLRDTGSRAPGRGNLNFYEILKAYKNKLLCIEYKTRNPKKDFEAAAKFIYLLLSG